MDSNSVSPARLPTDSLYKFMAIAGLVLFIGPLSAGLMVLTSTVTELRALGIDVAAMEAEADHLLTRVNLARASKTDSTIESTDRVGIRERLFDLDTRRRVSRARLDAVRFSMETVDRVTPLAIGAMTLGLFLAIVGFSSWYRLEQFPRDAILQRLAKKGR